MTGDTTKLQGMLHDWDDVEEYLANTVIFAERDPADLMYIVLAGEVELTLGSVVANSFIAQLSK